MAFPDVCYARPTLQMQATAVLKGFFVCFISVLFGIYPLFFLLIWVQGIFRRVKPQLLTPLLPSVFTTGNPDVKYICRIRTWEKKKKKRSEINGAVCFVELNNLDLTHYVIVHPMGQCLCFYIVSWDLVTHWSGVPFRHVCRQYWTQCQCFYYYCGWANLKVFCLSRKIFTGKFSNATLHKDSAQLFELSR